MPNNERMFQYGKNVLVTGATSGIGLATAKYLADKGFQVYGLARHRGPEVSGVRWIQADTTKVETLEKAFDEIPELGIIIHCAGFGISGSAECTPLDAAKSQMEVNYFGVLNVNNVFLKKLRENEKSLVLITSSVAGLLPIPFQSHYSSSKYALEAYGEALAMEGKPFGIRVCIVEPGDTKTGFTKNRMHYEPESSPYFDKCVRAVQKMEKDEQEGKSPETVARVFFKQITKKKPNVRIAVGSLYKVLCFLSRVMPYPVRQFILSKMY